MEASQSTIKKINLSGERHPTNAHKQFFIVLIPQQMATPREQ
jgi:hypothetical protein